MFIWDGDWVWFAIVHEADVRFCIHDIDWFLGRFVVEKGFFPATGIPRDTKRAVKEVGPLEADECYFWVPELLLGGTKEGSAINKGQFSEALSILAQLAEPRIQKI
jgi:hypothetical protein